jgi:hypothetical protein
MGFNSVFKGLRTLRPIYRTGVPLHVAFYIYFFQQI